MHRTGLSSLRNSLIGRKRLPGVELVLASRRVELCLTPAGSQVGLSRDYVLAPDRLPCDAWALLLGSRRCSDC